VVVVVERKEGEQGERGRIDIRRCNFFLFLCRSVADARTKEKKTDVVDFWRENGRESKAEEERGLSLVF